MPAAGDEAEMAACPVQAGFDYLILLNIILIILAFGMNFGFLMPFLLT